MKRILQKTVLQGIGLLILLAGITSCAATRQPMAAPAPPATPQKTPAPATAAGRGVTGSLNTVTSINK